MPRRCYTLLLTFALLALGTALAPQPAPAQDFVVNSTADADDANVGDGTCDDGNGNCTFRAAVQEASSDPDRDVIGFSQIPTNNAGFAPITLTVSTIFVENPIEIDGSTAPGYPTNTSAGRGPIVQLDGANNPSGGSITDVIRFRGAADNSRIEGISVVNAPSDGDGIRISLAENVTIVDCFAGLDLDGTTEEGNGGDGVFVNGPGATLDGNVISGNGENGVEIGDNDAELVRNRIGLNAAGNAAKANAEHGVLIRGNQNRIGGQTGTGGFATPNYISGNGVYGIFVRGDENTIVSNRIGTNVDGSSAIGNGKAGVLVAGTGTSGGNQASDNVIGGPDGVDGNVISGNGGGITLGVASNNDLATGTTIRNNTIGLNEAEDAALPNGAGVFIGLANSSSSNPTTIAENTIAGNNRQGVFIFGDDRNLGIDIVDNYIGTNSSFATGLGNGGDGVEVNPNPSIVADGDRIQVADNVIGSNGANGIEVTGSFHGIHNNYVGVAPDASNTNLANGDGDDAGILLDNGSARLDAVIVGGRASGNIPGDGVLPDGTATPNGTGNVIGYNDGNGILINGKATNAIIRENYIGTNPDDDDLGNGGPPVVILATSDASTGHVIGYEYGSTFSDPHPADGGEGNVMRFNGIRGGVEIPTELGISTVENTSIRGNVVSDIILDRPSPDNDNGDEDADEGPNRLQNSPVINSVSESNGQVTIDYTIFTSRQNADYGQDGLKVDFYAADGSDGARKYLDTQFYDSPSQSKQKVIDLSSISGVDPSDSFVATATDASGNTSEFTNDSNPLPVELASFEARQSGEDAVRLTWQTASETGNAGFRIQRRDAPENGSPGSWQKVGFVESKASGGTTTEAKTYRFVAEDLRVGPHQFRLQQVDLDGSAHLHDPVTVEVRMQQALRLGAPAPNPVSGRATVRFAVREETEATLQLYNTLGQRVATVYRGTPPAGDGQTVDVSTTGLSSGVYFLRLRAGGQAKTQRVTVVR